MTREEAQEYAKTMSYKEAVLNCIHSKGIAYRKASLIKLRELAEIADKLERDNDMTREEAIQVLQTALTSPFIYGEYADAIGMAIEALSADAAQGYTKWLEKIISDNEETNEWLCDIPDLDWCENNCHYSSIQAKCLRHIYETSKGGDDE